MRREVLQAAVTTIIRDLKDSSITAMLEDGISKTRPGVKSDDSNKWLSFTILQDWFVRSSKYGAVERDVLGILQAESLLDPAMWQRLTAENDRADLWELANRVRFILTNLPNLLSLLDRSYQNNSLDGSNVSAKYDGLIVQTVILTDEGENFSSTDRLIYVLQAISDIYAVIAEINGDKSSVVSVVGLDSGSEKSFDFLGLAKFMEELRETLLSLWQNIVFHRQNTALRNFAVVGDALPILAKIKKLEDDEAIDVETSARLRERIIRSANKFADAGAVIPEMDAMSHFEPKKIMRAQPRLLAGPSADFNQVAPSIPESPAGGSVNEQQQNTAVPSPAFSPEQLAQIAIMLAGQSAETSSVKTKAPRSRKPSSSNRSRVPNKSSGND